MYADQQRSRKAKVLALAIAAILCGLAVMWYVKSGAKPMAGQNSAGSRKWEFTASGAITGIAVADYGTVYATSADGFLWALDSSGKLIWKFDAGPMKAGPTLGTDGTIYLTNSQQKIYAVDRTGKEVWSNGAGPYADTTTGIGAAAVDYNYFYTAWRGQVRAVRLKDGSFAWPAGIGYTQSASISVLPTGNIVYPGAGRMDEADSDGKTVWQYPVMDPPMTVELIERNRSALVGKFWIESGIAVSNDGTLYAGAGDARMVAISSSGKLLWDFPTKPRSVNRASPVISQDGTIYFASGDANLCAVNPDGSSKWTLDLSGPVIGTPILAEDGTIYVANDTGLIAVSADGKLTSRTPIGGWVEAAANLGPDGTIYVGTHTGTVVAFAGSHGGLMKSPWPKFQADTANSGRVPQD